MSLTEEEKRKIEEEEKYRTQVKSGIGSKKKGPGCFTILLIVFVGIPLLATFFFTVINPAKFTNDSKQTTVSTPTPTTISTTEEEEACTLQAKVTLNDEVQLIITNNGKFDWNEVVIKINSGLFSGGYEHKTQIPAGTTYTVGLMQFADDKGNRFNPFQQVVKEIFITDRNTFCDWYTEVE